MRKALASMLALAFLALGLAGIAWSGQSPVQGVQAEPQAPPAAPEGDLEANLLELFPEPVETTGACCYADCKTEQYACKDACPPIGTPEGEACREQCNSDFLACKSHC